MHAYVILTEEGLIITHLEVCCGFYSYLKSIRNSVLTLLVLQHPVNKIEQTGM